MPLLGFGVYQNYTTQDSVLEALQAGYRWALIPGALHFISYNPPTPILPVILALQAC